MKANLHLRVAARFKKKKKLDSGNVLYVYSERQIALRNRKKAERLEKLGKSIGKLRSQVKKDLKSGEPDKMLTALAVALIDETFERVGNDESAEEGHFGVTGWQKSHVKFSKGKATISYVGKSGVKQKKTVQDAALVRALRDAYEGCDGDCLFNYGTGRVTASKVNEYLKSFDVTAKDLRGYHANRVMREQLKAARKGALPEDKKERTKQLKDEFKKALEETAKSVGHEPSTLKSQYLIPGLAEQFLKDGTVMEKKASSSKPTKAQIDYARHLLKQIGAEEPDWDKLSASDVSSLIDDLKKKRGKPVFYGNGQFSHWEKKAATNSASEFAEEFFRRHPRLKRYAPNKIRDKEQRGSKEAEQYGAEIWIYPKFWTHDRETQDFILAHEIGHHVLDEYSLSRFMKDAEEVGVDPWDTSALPFGQFNSHEAFADAFATYFLDPGDLKRRYPEWGTLVERTLKMASSQRVAACYLTRVANDWTWEDVEKELRRLQEMDRLARGPVNEKVAQQILAIPTFDMLPHAFAEWYRLAFEPPLREPLHNAATETRHAWRMVVWAYERKPDDTEALNAKIEEARKATERYMDEIRAIFEELTPARLTYQGFKIENMDRMPYLMLKLAFDKIDFLVQFFKEKGMLKLLQQTLTKIELSMRPHETAAAHYHSRTKHIKMHRGGLKDRAGKLWKDWIQEVLVHELGHHVHYYLHPEAWAVWEQPWKQVEEKRAVRDRISGADRDRFYNLLEKHNFDPSKAAKKLAGLDKVKFAAWLRKPGMGESLLTPKTFRPSKRGQYVFEFLRDPEGFTRRRLEIAIGQDDYIKEQYLPQLKRIHEWVLMLGDATALPLDPDIIEEVKKVDPSVEKAIESLEMPSEYAKTNLQEDFAETFVVFMLDPGRLSATAKFRMQQALAISGLYGKAVGKYGASGVVTQAEVDKWKSDLRRMTKIYKDIDPNKEDYDLDSFLKARTLFKTFRENWEKWVYKIVMPQVERDSEKWLERQIREKAWSAYIAIELGAMFPSAYNYKSGDHEPAPWQLRGKIDKNVRRYQKAFNEAFKVIEEYIKESGGELQRLDTEETYNIGPVTVVVENAGRREHGKPDEYNETSLQETLEKMRSVVQKIQGAGFGDAIKGLIVTVNFTGPGGLTSGQYNPQTDKLELFPLGIGSDSDTIVHELGHRFWFRHVPQRARAHWEEVMASRSTTIEKQDVERYIHKYVRPLPQSDVKLYIDDRRKNQILDQASREESVETVAKIRELIDFFPLPVNTVNDLEESLIQFKVGDKVDLESISSYGATSPVEAFAEAFRLWVTKGPRSLGPWTREFFLRITQSGGAKTRMARQASF